MKTGSGAIARSFNLATDVRGVLPVSSGGRAGGVGTGNKIAILGNSITAQLLPNSPDSASGWLATHVYSASAAVAPSVLDLSNGYYPIKYVTSAGGTSGSTEPVWPLTIGATVLDGTVTWTATAPTAYGPALQICWWHLAQALSGQRLQEVFIAGRSGQISTEILSYVDRALAASPDIVYFATMFENDCWPGVAPTLATVSAAWTSVATKMDAVRAAGKVVMLNTVLPNGNIDASSLFTGYSFGTGSKSWLWLNEQIKAYAAARPDVILFDAASVYTDPNNVNPVWPENTTTYLSASGAGQQLKKTDGVHPYIAGAWYLAQGLSTILTARFPETNHFGFSLDPNNYYKNPQQHGTSGTAGTGVTSGTPANLMTLNAYGTVTTAAITKVARSDISGNWTQSTYVVTAADNLDYSHTGAPLSISPLTAGSSVLQMFQEIKVLANPTLLTQPIMLCAFYGTPNLTWNNWTIGGSTSQDLGQFITTDTIFTIKTFPLIIPSTCTTMQQYSKVYGRGAASFTAQYGRGSYKPVPLSGLQ